jgi:hypothetical protein
MILKNRIFISVRLEGVKQGMTLRSFLRELKLLSPVSANEKGKVKLKLLIDILDDLPLVDRFDLLDGPNGMLYMEKDF